MQINNPFFFVFEEGQAWSIFSSLLYKYTTVQNLVASEGFSKANQENISLIQKLLSQLYDSYFKQFVILKADQIKSITFNYIKIQIECHKFKASLMHFSKEQTAILHTDERVKKILG